LHKLLVKAFLFFGLFPFVSPFPIHTDVQPVSLLLALFIFCIDFIFLKVRLNRIEVFFLILAIFSFVFIGVVGDFELRHRVGLLFAFVIYYGVRRYHKYLTGGILLAASIFNFLGVLWHFFSPSSFIPFASIFTRAIKITEIGARGASGFAPENSFAAALALVYIILSIYLMKKEIISRLSHKLVFVLSACVILLSQSGLGYVIGLMLVCINFLISTNFKAKQRISALVVFTLVTFSFSQSSFIDTRGGQLIKVLFQDPSLLLLDGSLGERFVGIHVGITSLFHYPIGSGGGSYPVIAREMNSKYNILKYHPNARAGQLDGTVSAFGRYTTELGCLFILFIVVLLSKSFARTTFPLLASTLACLFIMASFSITFPPTYILLAFSSLKTEKGL